MNMKMKKNEHENERNGKIKEVYKLEKYGKTKEPLPHAYLESKINSITLQNQKFPSF